MMNHSDQEYLVQKLRAQYTEREYTKLDALKKLDQKVKRPANIFGYCFGTIGALVMGSGMSLIMTDVGSAVGLENPLPAGLALGIAGMLMAIADYPIYRRILGSRRKQYAQQIVELSDELLRSDV